MKDLGPTKQILGIRIIQEKKAKKLCLSQEKYIEKILQKFNMNKSKTSSSPLVTHIRLSIKKNLLTNEVKEDMKRVLYASVVGSLMYIMVWTRPDITYVIGSVS